MKREIILVTRNIEDVNELEIVFGSLPGTNDLIPFFYKSLDCKSIDVINVSIGGKPYYLIVDDYGKLDSKSPMALLYNNNQCVDIVAGAFIITSKSKNGSIKPLSDDDFYFIDKNLQVITQENGYQVAKFQY